ncbi:MAG: amino acid adenylation domain-containing protein, partial [bacterium]|nr:amino acid adenylation domain-containing protein [bacterium]
KLKYVLLAGEKVIPARLKKWYDLFDERIQLVNIYGPTETTLAKIFYLIRKKDAYTDNIPVGKPMNGARVIILDENMNICDDMVVGELYIRTPYRSHGYYNDPELNKQKFIQNPFNSKPGDIIYGTGDLGRKMPDGNLQLMGRIDRQVKIRGMRIELEGIENVLAEYPSITGAVVIKREAPGTTAALFACITLDPSKLQSSEDSLLKNIKQHLHDHLPPYMVPAKLKIIDKLPRKTNLKVNYTAVADLFKDEKIECIAPRDEVE